VPWRRSAFPYTTLFRSPFVVVEARAAQARVVQFEPERPHQVQPGPGVGAQADGVAGIGRNFRADEYDVEHGFHPGAAAWGAVHCRYCARETGLVAGPLLMHALSLPFRKAKRRTAPNTRRRARFAPK